MAHIQKVGDRAKLKARAAPYFENAAQGCAIGFRKMSASSDGTWVARWRDPDTDRQKTRALGALDTMPASERYDAAVRLARPWWQRLQRGGVAETVTVKQACALYVESMEREGRAKAARDIRRRFAQYVNGAPIAKIDLDKLQPRHVAQWRNHMQDTPTKDGKKRSAVTLNRDMVCLKAALNYALEKRLTTANVWQPELKPIKGVEARRDLYLDASQRQKLIDAARVDLRPFLRALCSLPLRPGAMAALTAGDFDARLRTINVKTDKAGAGRKITLPTVTAQLFNETARDKLPAAPLFSRYDGAPWIKDAYKHPFKDAVKAAGLPPETVAYTLRHSTITDLIVSGADPLTVAQISGTSLLMIQKHYGHLTPKAAISALERIAV